MNTVEFFGMLVDSEMDDIKKKIINLKQERDNLKQALFDVINFTGLSSDGKELCFGSEIDGVSGVTSSRNYPSTAKMINELMGGK